MAMDQRLVYLFNRYFDGLATEPEKNELMQLAEENGNQEQLLHVMQEAWESYSPGKPILSVQDKETLLAGILEQAPVYSIAPKSRIAWWKYAAAAVIIVMVGTASYFVLNRTSSDNVIVQAPVTDVKAPETNRAMITLASGEKIFLDSAGSGHLATEGQMKLVKLANGEIAYQSADGTISQELIYNTLSNPRGSKIAAITLSDGSKVWLNAGSSLTYPVAFVSNERKVSITGEAYFEVAHNASMPFKVSKGEMEVQVLGTHFNVNAYEDEQDIKVTLLEGSVIVKNQLSGVTIKPGQQAIITSNQKPETRNGVDLDAVMAWKNGYFQFNGMGIQELMRQLERWYDITVGYEGRIPEREFAGQIHRNASLSQVLQILKESNVNFRLENRKLIVTP